MDGAFGMAIQTALITGLCSGLSCLVGYVGGIIIGRRMRPSINGLVMSDGTIQVSSFSAADFIAACTNKRVVITG
jgi:hypothetical protein